MPPAADRADPAAVHPLVVAEFEYLGQCAFQANEDRARAPQLFAAMLATLAAALYSTKADGQAAVTVRLVFAILFAAEAVVGVLTLRHLARLRRSWLSAVAAQNQLLQRAVAADPTLKGWFAWLEAPLPRAYNRGSVGWLMAAGVALLTGLASAAVVFIALTLPALRGAAAADAAIGSGAAAAASAFASLVFGLVAFRYGYRAPLEAGGDAGGGLSNRRRRAL